MLRKISLGAFTLALMFSAFNASQARPLSQTEANSNLDAMVARYAAENDVPEELIRRVIKRESRGNPRVVSAGNYGLMQIKPATARGLGYTGSAAGLLDPETNMTYAVKYLAGAYRVARGNSDLAVHYYAAGYYYAAKGRHMLDTTTPKAERTYASAEPVAASAPTQFRNFAY
jgi:soluble lytic murein transglycosylase-like protein